MASSIGKFVIGLGSAAVTNENSLANVKFDFSLVKVAAPVEYQGLGLSLSPKRKKAAEDEQTHTVARKLAALFADELPEVPNLISTYGKRASEIAENPIVNPKGSQQDGAFRDHIGLDGTTVWATATSGHGAVAIHLLGCMLARIWKGPQASSIWYEMIEARKIELQKRVEGNKFHLNEVTAIQIQIGREQLAEWDASARSNIIS
jgi:hypothetical protein